MPPVSKLTPDEQVEQFLRENTGPVVIGIDPGASGAIAFLCGDAYLVVDIPTVSVVLKTKNKSQTCPKCGVKVTATPKSRERFECRKCGCVQQVPMVTGNAKQRTKYDLGALNAIFEPFFPETKFKPIPAKVVLEKVGPQPRDTAVTAFTLGVGWGMFPLYFQRLRLPLHDVPPAVWKRRFNLLGTDKDASRLLAQRCFPDAPLSAKKHHNRAEALLIAKYGRDYLKPEEDDGEHESS